MIGIKEFNMKYVCVLMFFLTGCSGAKISDYNQGCRDGVNTFVENGLHASIEKSVVDKSCTELDDLHNLKKDK
jgi:hypothetical protein